MRRILADVALLCALASPAFAQAQGQLSQLPAMTGPLGGLVVECVSGCGSGGVGASVDISSVAGVVIAPGASVPVVFGGSLPTGANTIGAINLAQYTPNIGRLPVLADINGSVAVTGTFFQPTQPVSLLSVPAHDVTNAGTFAVQATGSVTANAGTNLNTSALALETTLQAVKTAVELIDNCISGARCLVTEDSAAAILSAVSSIKTNTDPLLVAGAGGYVRQDANGTIAKETGGNLATLVTNSTGVASSVNSSSVPLAGDATFTGTYENIKSTAFLSVSVFADQGSATDGLIFDWSHDCVTTDRSEATTVNASSGRAFSLVPRAQCVRLRYTNGPAAQGAFRLGTVYHPTGTGILTKPLDGAVTTENFAELVQAALVVKDATGSGYSPMQSGNGASMNGVPRMTIASDTVVMTRPGPGLPLWPCNKVRRYNCQP